MLHGWCKGNKKTKERHHHGLLFFFEAMARLFHLKSLGSFFLLNTIIL
jgi:hypothetical protein